MKKAIITALTFAMLHPCIGCSSSHNEIDPTPQPQERSAASDMVIYEANPRIFATDNAFAAIEANLEHIKELGTTVLWLMPVNEPGVKKSVNSPYCIKDYKALNARYGTKDELKSLVKAAHTKGMKVILDWVANHTSWDHAWITEHPEWYTQDAGGNIVQPQEQPWADVADLNFDNQAMQEAMIDAMKYWITEAGIDGYRLDYAEGVPDAFWKKAITELRKLDKELLMLAEGGKVSLMSSGFDLLYGWGFHGRLKDLYAGKSSLESLYAMNKTELEGMPEGTMRLRYSTNHDQASEVSPIACYGGERGAMSAFVIATLLEGVPLIYSSQEAAYPSKLNFFNYRAIDLKSNKPFYQEMAQVVKAYKATAKARGGELKVYNTGNVVSFYRKNGEHAMFVMVNTTDATVQVKVPMERSGETMNDALTGERVKLPVSVTLNPYQYYIYQK